MLIVKIAVKNLLRHKRRTIITGIAIAVGLIFFIFMDSLLVGWYGNTERQYIEYEVASGRIVKKSWWKDKSQFLKRSSYQNGSTKYGSIMVLSEQVSFYSWVSQWKIIPALSRLFRKYLRPP